MQAQAIHANGSTQLSTPTTGELQRQIMTELARPFHPSFITWKPTNVKDGRALALIYADLRAYQQRLDEVLGYNWNVRYEPWGDDRIIATVTIWGEGHIFSVGRSSTGEVDNQSERREIGGTVAEAQAFKRACAMLGLGRYLYSFGNQWVQMEGNAISKASLDKLRRAYTDWYMKHAEQPEQGDLSHVTVGGSEAVNPEGDALFEGSGFAPQPGAQPSSNGGGEPLYSKDAIIKGARPLHERSRGAMSEAQGKLLQRVLKGLGVNAQAFLVGLTGAQSIDETGSFLASSLIDKLSQEKWNRELGATEPNALYDERLARSVIHHWGGGQ